MNDWIEIGRIDDIPRLGARVVNRADGNIAIFRTASDEIFAVADLCPHKQGPLSQGIVHGRRVTCPLHGLVLELAEGTAVGPDEGCAATYPVRIEDGQISICLTQSK
jgi:nitrite reductase (NADH) small subunit